MPDNEQTARRGKPGAIAWTFKDERAPWTDGASMVGDVVVEIDLQGIRAALGAKALRNASHETLTKFVRVTAHNVRIEPKT